MKVTIRDVARHAKVGIGTVSRALNDDPEIAEETKRRVLDVCAALGYRRSSLGRSLKRGVSDNIGVAIMSRHAPVILNPFYAEVIGGIEAVLDEADKHLLLSSLRRNEQLLSLAQEGRVDGLIVVGCDISAAVLEQLRNVNLPVVLVDNAFPGIPSVVTDHYGGGMLAAQHLLESGCTRFAFVAENLDNPNFQARLAGFQKGLQDHGIALLDAAIAAGGDSWDGGYHAMQTILASLNEPPDAVFAANDPAALSAAKALQERGLHVPGDTAVIGFDDIHLAEHLAPPLTTVRVDKRGLGRTGAGYLLELLAGQEVPLQTVLPTTLMVRDSTRRDRGAS